MLFLFLISFSYIIHIRITVYPISETDNSSGPFEERINEENFYKLNTTRRLGGKSSCKKNERKGSPVFNSELESILKRDFQWW